MKKLVTDSDFAKRKWGEAKTLRNFVEPEWAEAARHCLPGQYQGMRAAEAGPLATMGYGQRETRQLSYDGTGRKHLPRAMAIMERMLTPRGQTWHKLETDDPSLNRQRRVQEFYEEVTIQLFRQRNNSQARFVSGISEAYASILTFGNAALSVRPRRITPARPLPGFAYRTFPMRDVYWLVNEDGDRDIIFLSRWLNARQLSSAYPDGTMPEVVRRELDKQGGPSETRYFQVVEILCVNEDMYEPRALDFRRHSWLMRPWLPEASAYLDEIKGMSSGSMILPRHFTEPGDIYGSSPAIAASPTMGGLSAMKRHLLKIAERRADPPWLTYRSNIIVDTRPNAVTAGGMSAEGRPLVAPLGVASQSDTRTTETIMADDRAEVGETFYGKLFELLDETREMTAREVAERAGKEFALVAPIMGRMMEELIDPMVTREVDIMVQEPRLADKLPDVPPELVEAQGEFKVVLTSPMARAERMEDVQGFMQAVEAALNIAAQTGNPAYAEQFRYDQAIPDIARILNVPTVWLKTPEEMEADARQRAEQQAVDTAIQAAPAVAGLAA